MENPFTHLHVHTDYSTYDGICNIPNMVRHAKQSGFESLAISDHGTLGGAIKFYENCRIEGINPILGLEAYVCNDMRKMSPENNRTHHLLLLAISNEGYHNLVKISSLANREGFYRKPRVDLECLSQHKEGLVVTSACILGEFSSAIVYEEDGIKKAKDIAASYRDVFGENYFIELQLQMYPKCHHNHISEDTQTLIDKQKVALVEGRKIARDLGIKTVITNDVHYICQDDFLARFLKMSINQMGGRSNENALEKLGHHADTLDYHLKSPQQMYQEWERAEKQSLINTYEIGKMADIKIDMLSLGDNAPIKLPNYAIPEDDEEYLAYLEKDKSDSPEEVKYVKHLVTSELVKRKLIKPEYVNRIKKELGVVSSNPVFCKDFLIVRDYIEAARERNIFVGPGRGSAAGSLVLYLLGVTDVDPIYHDLDFDRFLSADEVPYTTEEDYF